MVTIPGRKNPRRSNGAVSSETKRLRFLSEASRAFATAALDRGQLFQLIARQVADGLGDASGVHLVTDGPEFAVAALAHRDPAAEAVLRAALAVPVRLAGSLPGRVVRTREPLLIPEVSKDELRHAVRPEHQAYLEQVGVHSLMLAPLMTGSRVLGVLGASRSTPGRPYTEDDLALLVDLAGRAAMALENVRLYEAERDARRETARRYERLSALYQFASVLGGAGTVEEMYARSLETLSGALGTPRTALLLYDEQGVMRFKAWRGLSDAYRAAVEGHSPWPRDDPDPQPVFVADTEQDPSLEGLRDVLRAEGIRALGFFPLVYDKRLIGKFMLYYAEPHAFAPEDVPFVQSVASHLAFATERKRAEEALRENEGRYRALVETVPGMVWRATADGRIDYYSEGFFEYTGLTQGDTAGPEWRLRSVLHPDDAEALFERWEEAHHGGDSFEIEARLRRADGAYRWHLHRAVRMRDDARGEVYWSGTSVDIHDRKQMEEEITRLLGQLADQARRIDSLVSTVPGVVWEAWGEPDSAVQRIDFVSDYIEDMLGYTVDEWVSTPNFWLTIVHPDDKERAAAEAAAIFAGGKGGQSQFRWVARDGRVLWVDAHSVVVRDDAGRPLGMRGVTIDVSERIRMEEELQRSAALQQATLNAAKERLEFLAEASVRLSVSLDYITVLRELAAVCVPHLGDWCAVDMLDEDGAIHRLAVTHADPVKDEIARKFESRVAHDISEVPEDAVARLRAGQTLLTPEITDEALVRIARDEEHLAIMRRLGFRSSMIVPVLTRERLLGAITLVVGDESGRRYSADDVTLAEELARRAALAVENARLYAASQAIQEELRRAGEAKDEFLGMISHELRTPVTVVYGHANILRSRGDRIDGETRAELVDDIAREGERLRRLVENMLVLARLELGQPPASLEPLRLEQAVARLVQDPNEAQDVSVRIEPGLPPLVADATSLELILRNLLGNARKYGGPEPRIEIEARREGESEACIVVMDRGRGLAPDELPSIFERFYRSRETATHVTGAGMGLTVCKRLVEAQGGRIWAELRPGGGLAVKFTLAVHADDAG